MSRQCPTQLRLRSSLAQRTCDETADTIIEVVVAALLAVVIIAAAAASFLLGNDSSLASQRQSELISIADQQIENIRQAVKTNPYGFADLAMSSAPAAGSSTTLGFSPTSYIDPNHFVTTCGTSSAYDIETNYDNTREGLASSPVVSPCTVAGVEPLIIATGGACASVSTCGAGQGFVTPRQTNVSIGSGTATVDTYVTGTNVGCNASLGTGVCTNDARRVVVAVAFNNGGRYDMGGTSPIYVSTIFTNPTPTNAPNSAIGLTLGAQIG